jgi:hypothetical protein
VLALLGAFGILLNLRCIVRFAALGAVLASPTADATPPCLVRVLQQYGWVLQVLMVPPFALQFVNDATAELASQCVYIVLGLLCLSLAAVLLYISFYLSKIGQTYRNSV